MAISVTNRKDSQALRGESVLVTLDPTDSAKLPHITIGMKATIISSNMIGYVSYVDTYGHYIKINPESPATNLESSTKPGYLAVAEPITIE